MTLAPNEQVSKQKASLSDLEQRSWMVCITDAVLLDSDSSFCKTEALIPPATGSWYLSAELFSKNCPQLSEERLAHLFPRAPYNQWHRLQRPGSCLGSRYLQRAVSGPALKVASTKAFIMTVLQFSSSLCPVLLLSLLQGCRSWECFLQEYLHLRSCSQEKTATVCVVPLCVHRNMASSSVSEDKGQPGLQQFSL